MIYIHLIAFRGVHDLIRPSDGRQKDGLYTLSNCVIDILGWFGWLIGWLPVDRHVCIYFSHILYQNFAGHLFVFFSFTAQSRAVQGVLKYSYTTLRAIVGLVSGGQTRHCRQDIEWMVERALDKTAARLIDGGDWICATWYYCSMNFEP